MDYGDIITLAYTGDGHSKLAEAKKLLLANGEQLRRHEAIQRTLQLMEHAAIALDQAMAAMDMGPLCTACAATPDGGCCSAYMGHENNDVLQLLMNLLAGVPVESMVAEGDECCFLGEKGCVLKFKPIFCLNYLCHQIRDKATDNELLFLEKKTGALLGYQVSLEKLLIEELTV